MGWRTVCTLGLTCLISILASPSPATERLVVDLSQVSETQSPLGLAKNRGGWKYLRGVDLYIVDPASREDEKQILSSLKENGALAFREDESDVTLEGLPDDPLVAEQGWTGSGMLNPKITDAWDLTTGSSDVIVAVIDSGIDTKHPDLQENLWTNFDEEGKNDLDDDQDGYIDDLRGFNFRDKSDDVEDKNGHGTHIAGIIGAIGNNGIGVAGINWRVKLMPLKFTDSEGHGSTVAAIEAINYAIIHGARIINGSWSVKQNRDTSDATDILKKAIEKAGQAGVLFVAAAGNHFDTGQGIDIDKAPAYPASFGLGNTLSVAALGEGMSGLADYSNFGPHSVDLAAPGSRIISTLNGGVYGSMTGTSVAAAFVSGSAALMLSIDPNLSPSEIKSILKDFVTQDQTLKEVVHSGGSLNVERSVVALASEETVSASSQGGGRTSKNSGGCSLIPD